MVRLVKHAFTGTVTVRHLDEAGMKGGCLGCLHCAAEDRCVYRDGFMQFWEEMIDPADIIVIAGSIRDRFLSSGWKQFMDWSFYHGHIPAMNGKQVICLIHGPLSDHPILREVPGSVITIWGAGIVAVISDESSDPDATSRQIHTAAMPAVAYLKTGFPCTTDVP